MNGLFQSICRIGIFMICAQAVLHFRPQETYEKYLKLLVSAMVLIQLFLPISRILFHGDSEDIAVRSQAFLDGLEAEMSAAESRAYETDALLEQMTLEEIRRRVEEAQAAQKEAEQEEAEQKEAGKEEAEQEEALTESSGATARDAAQIDQIRVEEIRIQISGHETEQEDNFKTGQE